MLSGGRQISDQYHQGKERSIIGRCVYRQVTNTLWFRTVVNDSFAEQHSEQRGIEYSNRYLLRLFLGGRRTQCFWKDRFSAERGMNRVGKTYLPYHGIVKKHL